MKYLLVVCMSELHYDTPTDDNWEAEKGGNLHTTIKFTKHRQGITAVPKLHPDSAKYLNLYLILYVYFDSTESVCSTDLISVMNTE